jgi:hypothetical protein
MTMPASDPSPPKAFISYSWDDDTHTEWVKQLATRLRGDGVDLMLDRWHAVPGDQLPAFMERAVRENDFVVAVCTARYKERSDKRGGGVGYEGDIMTAEALTGGNQRKFIPVLRRGSWREAAPSCLLGKFYIDLSADPYSEWSYESLLRTLHGENEPAPPIGRKPDFKFLQKVENASPETGSVHTPPETRMGVVENFDDRIRSVLRPLMASEPGRQARLSRAFHAYPGLLDRIATGGETGVFLSHLLQTLRDYGEVEPGRPAIAVPLESVRDEVGAGDRQRIDQILRTVRGSDLEGGP